MESRKPNLTKLRLTAFVTLGIFVLFFVGVQLAKKRSITNHLIRWFKGESGAEQVVSDLAQDLHNPKLIDPLLEWTSEAMVRYDKGQLKTTKDSPNWPRPPLTVVDSSEYPQFVKKLDSQPVEIAIYASNQGKAQAVIIDWYLYGIVFTGSNDTMPFPTLHAVHVSPGVFTVWYDNK